MTLLERNKAGQTEDILVKIKCLWICVSEYLSFHKQRTCFGCPEMTIKEEQVSQQFKRTLYSRIHEVMWSLFLHGKNSFDNLNEVNKKRSQDNLYNRTIMPNSFPIIDIRRKKNTGE